MAIAGAFIAGIFLWWLSRKREEDVGEMVVDQDLIDDDDPGEDIDDAE